MLYDHRHNNGSSSTLQARTLHDSEWMQQNGGMKDVSGARQVFDERFSGG